MTEARPPVRVWLAPIALYLLVLVVIAAAGGGWIALGRVDPLLAVPGAGWAAVAAIWANGGRPDARLLVAAAAAGGSMLAAVGLADAYGQLPVEAWLIAAAMLFAAVGAAGLLATLARRFARRRRWEGRGILLIGLPIFAIAWTAVTWRQLDDAYRIEQRDYLHVGLVTSLPLSGRHDVASMLHPSAQQPTYRFLHRTTRLSEIAHIDAASLDGLDALLLAHPQALAPDELVAIDDWVRAGGRAVVLADGLSSWAPPYPLGDNRNPPVTSLLDPLLSRWGVELDAPGSLLESPVVVRDSGQRLQFFSPGRFLNRDSRCRISAAGVVAECAVGVGRVTLVGDADFLHAQYWTGSSKGESAISWTSGNMLWLLGKLQGNRRGKAIVSRFLPSWSIGRNPWLGHNRSDEAGETDVGTSQ